jgi:hypothetical protein
MYIPKGRKQEKEFTNGSKLKALNEAYPMAPVAETGSDSAVYVNQVITRRDGDLFVNFTDGATWIVRRAKDGRWMFMNP